MFRLLSFLLLLLAMASCRPSDTLYDLEDALYRTGDDPRWATSRYDDAGWQTQGDTVNRGIFWVRRKIILMQRDSTQPLGLQLRAFGAFEVYWDGTLISRNGQLGSRTRPEVPGTEISYHLVPDSLAGRGWHQLALRTTQGYLRDDLHFVGVKLQSYPRLLREPLIVTAFVNLMAGALLMAALYYAFLFGNSRQREYGTLIFSVICLLCFALLMAEYAKVYLEIPYSYFNSRLEIIGWLTFAIALLVPLYFAIQFDLRRKGLFAGVLLVVLIAIYIAYYTEYDLTAERLSWAMWVAALFVVVMALRRRAKGSALVLAGLLASAVSSFFLHYDYTLFITYTIIVLCMLYLHTNRVRALDHEREAALLLSARLKLELLKKNIQPHFIKNTLTSLLDWVEESPKQGAVFIQALAREFDLLNNMAEATLIPVSQEIELCQTHLHVMQFRKEIRYELEQSGIDPTDQIPPAIFHTMLENGITHSLPPADGCLRFKLSFERAGKYKHYRLLACAPARPAEQGGKAGSGTGFQYIRARLQESYGTGYTFHSAAVPEGWLTSITIAQAP
ncbi:histidine kinase [Hymenobacter terrenus]|uniref:histidine kinase n=1 Tax=Hymenobacter terrenus TaxID=1629124 RepID=UPI000696BBD5|nr:histidine kinase [Hymenobacter terrenus]